MHVPLNVRSAPMDEWIFQIMNFETFEYSTEAGVGEAISMVRGDTKMQKGEGLYEQGRSKILRGKPTDNRTKIVGNHKLCTNTCEACLPLT